MTNIGSMFLFALHFVALISALHAASVTPAGRQLFGEWASCSSSPGMCINVDSYSCSGQTVTGECPGGSNILCCRSTFGISYGTCASSFNGLCKRATDCTSMTVSGLCPGPSGILCCTSPVTVPPPISPSLGDVPVAAGIYLESYPPTQTQFRGRHSNVRPVIVVHTAETGGTAGPPDNRAENTASFISTRTSYGSYHLLGDTDSIIQLVRFENAAFHDGTGSNEWSIGISLAIQAASWPSLDTLTKNRLVTVAAQMAVLAANWFESQGVGKPAAVQLTKAESDSASASGFISHGNRDPTRRSDPGAGFPWTEFLAEYNSRIWKLFLLQK